MQNPGKLTRDIGRAALIAAALSLTFALQAAATSEETPKNKAETVREPSYAISAAHRHNVMYDDQGRVWYWGGLEKLVNGVRSFEEYKPKLVNGLEDVASAHAGHTTDLLIKKDGTVWEWGYEYTAIDGKNGGFSFAPPRKIEGLERIVSVSSISSVGGAIDEDGSVWVWHIVPDGPELMPTKPMKLRDIQAVDLSVDDKVHILKADGTVWKWDAYVGNNGNGSYARPNTADSVTKVEGLRDIAAISHTTEGGKTYFAIKENGTVYGWGRNDHGNLGRSDYKPVSKPAVIPELKDAASIVTGYGSTLIAKKDGTVWTLGLEIGQYSPTLYTDKPKKVEGLENVVSVALGSDHALAVTKDGDIWSWGYWGTSNKEKPVLVSSADRLRFEK
ncbi:RCC1 domain-containing protein [Paenibacillus antri]|uniref:RCC1 domain-containing protein n=1 Tax=Paenibacillus antri TaxID=2582848 RepID=UPI0013050A3E|nr:hypothetical protein [Paenibacillus antri]